MWVPAAARSLPPLTLRGGAAADPFHHLLFAIHSQSRTETERVSPLRAVAIAAVTALALGLGACGEGEGESPYQKGSEPVSLQAVQAGPGPAIVTLHWVGRGCSELEAKADEGDPGEILIVLAQPREARCSGARAAQLFSAPLEREIGKRRIVDARTKDELQLATCRAPGDVPEVIKRSICRLENRGRERQ